MKRMRKTAVPMSKSWRWSKSESKSRFMAWSMSEYRSQSWFTSWFYSEC
jgi:hypothetical protein